MENVSTFEKATQVFHHFRNGWEANTKRTVAGKNWDITTLKTSSGLIRTIAQAVQDEGNGCISYMVFGNSGDRLVLYSAPGKATEKAVTLAHAEGLAVFEAKVDAGELGTEETVYPIEIGQVLFTDFRSEFSRRRAIFEILRPGKYRTVLLDGSDIQHDDHIRDHKEKFGIGTYYRKGDKISPSEVAELVIKAKQAIEQRQAAESAERQAAELYKKQMIEAGAKVLPAIPEGVQAVIVAVLYVDESDSQSDYFYARPTEKIYLAFSHSKRDLFPEFRKAAKLFEETAPFADGSADEFEQRESGGNKLGTYYRDGWKVKKQHIELEDLQIAIGEGRCKIDFSAKTEQAGEISMEGVQVVEYSDKALAVIGETYPIRQLLKEQGGRFNKFLKVNGETVAGWIFQKTNPPKFA